MAWYKDAKALTPNQSVNFDKLRSPGEETPDAGVYRCAVCSDEIGIAKGHTLPPQNHHQHAAGLGPIKWQMIVCAKNS
jgi:hypothetical protein